MAKRTNVSTRGQQREIESLKHRIQELESSELGKHLIQLEGELEELQGRLDEILDIVAPPEELSEDEGIADYSICPTCNGAGSVPVIKPASR